MKFLFILFVLKDISASQGRLCHLLSKNYKSACAICWENIVLHSHPEIEISFKFIPKILMSKECIHVFGPLCILANTTPKEFRHRKIMLHCYKTWWKQSTNSTLCRMEPTTQIFHLSWVSVGSWEYRVKLPLLCTGDLYSSGVLQNL